MTQLKRKQQPPLLTVPILDIITVQEREVLFQYRLQLSKARRQRKRQQSNFRRGFEQLS